MSDIILLFFSTPIPILINASSTSALVIYLFFFLAALIAASFNTFSRSAPVKPADVLASLSRSTSSPRGFLAACTFNISSRPATSGLPTTIFLSNLPGLNIAGSRISILLVAA